jgi:hypothetical protein
VAGGAPRGRENSAHGGVLQKTAHLQTQVKRKDIVQAVVVMFTSVPPEDANSVDTSFEYTLHALRDTLFSFD